ncbi:Hypothetical protein AJF4211_000970 [Avibacterium paragallinarum JF4211]|nr:Hypothetical protein AJF4211_000970 [Avibacterium paragallinarum JF4211]
MKRDKTQTFKFKCGVYPPCENYPRLQNNTLSHFVCIE